jgi:RNA polymerase sigma-70 factor (ECF subfamily)
MFGALASESLEASDDLLVERARQSDPSAFAEIYWRHEPVLSRRLRRVLVRLEDVEDAVQMTFLEAHRSLNRFRAGSSMEAWLHGIAFNVASRMVRSKGRSARLRDRLDQAPPSSPPVSAEEQAMRKQMLGKLYAAMDELPPKKRIAFAMYEGEGLKLAEIAALTGTSTQTVWARVESARNLIRQWFSAKTEQGGSP